MEIIPGSLISKENGGMIMYCKNCGTDVTNAKFCPKCGTCVETDGAVNPPPENNPPQKILTITQLKWFSFSVVLTAWGMLFMATSLVPYIVAQIRYDFSGYDTLTYICTAAYLFLSILVVVSLHRALKSSGYMETSQYKFSKVLALNKSNFLQAVIFAAFIVYSIINNREVTNGTLWRSSVIVLIVCCAIWVSWFLTFRKVRAEDQRMVLVAFFISFREFLISIVLFFAGDLLLGVMNNAFSGVMLIALMFAYPVIRIVLTKPVLANVYKVK